MELQEAIDQWRRCASDPMHTPAMQRICERTAQDLEIERDTGAAVCSCCHKSLAERGCDDNGRRYK